jgi:hypothetical protein
MRTSRPLGTLVIVFAILAAVFALVIAVVPPAVAPEVWSYPTAALPFTLGQILIGIHHLVMAAGLFAAWRIGLAGRLRLAAVGAMSSTIAMVLFAVLEFGSAAIADSELGSAATDTVGSLYGVLTVVLAAASIVYGIAIIRAHAWAGFTRLTVLVTGIYLIFPLIPAQFGPFLWRSVALIVWSLLYIGLGIGLRRGTKA